MKYNTTLRNLFLQPVLLKRVILTAMAVITMLSSYAVAKTSTGGNWSNAATWSPAGVPAAGDDVTITSGTVNVDITAVCNNLTINSGATLSLQSNAVTVGGNWVNNGSFNVNCQCSQNVVTFTGNGATIGGSTATQFYILTINTPGAANTVSLVTSGVGIQDNGTLNLNNGLFKIGAGNTFDIGNNGATTINSSTTGNFATTGTNGADGGTILVDKAGGGGPTFVTNSPPTNPLAFYNLQFGPSPGNGNVHWQVTNAKSVLINGILTVQDNNWQFVNTANAPIYGANSTLNINNNGQQFSPGSGGGSGMLWVQYAPGAGTINSASTPGYPNNVIIANTGTSASNYGGNQYGVKLSGNWSINGTLQVGTPTVPGLVDLDNGGSGTNNFSSGGIVIEPNSKLAGPGSPGAFTVNGNWSRDATATYSSNGGTVTFAGAGPDNISVSSGIENSFNNVTVSANVTLNSPVTINSTGTMTLTPGHIVTAAAAADVLTISNTSTSGITGGSTTSYVNGPLAWQMAATSSLNYVFPIGGTSSYLPLTLSPNTTTSTKATVQAFNSGSGGTPDGTTVTSISGSEYWSISTSAPFSTGANVSVDRPGTPIGSYNALAKSSSKTGTYSAIGGGVTGTGISNASIGTTSPWFIAMVVAPLSVQMVSSVNTTCASTTGSITVQGSGGQQPYKYKLDAGGYSAPTSGSFTFSGLNPGAHSAYVQDNLGNTAGPVTVTVLGSLQINNNKDTSICSGASAPMTAVNLQSGGATPTPAFSWTSIPAGFTASTASINPSPVVTTQYIVSSTLYTNLLTNPSFEQGNSGFTSGFQIPTGTLPYGAAPANSGANHTGYYSIVGAANDLCIGFTAYTPHSGGLMMVCDGPTDGSASTTPVWQETLTGLSSATYTFSYYYGYADATNPNQIQATINGVALTPTVTMVGPWAQFTATWTGSGTAVIKLFDVGGNNNQDLGNDFVLDDMAFYSPCSVTDTMKVTVVTTAIAGTVTAAQTICSGSSPAALTLSANTPTTAAVVKWQSSPSAGFGSPTDIVETSHNLSSADMGTLTTNTYYRAVVQSCPSNVFSNAVLVTVTAPPTTSVAGPAQTICSSGTATLAANTAAVGTGTWSVTSGPSTSAAQFSNTASPTAVFTPGGGAGVYVLQWSITNAPCPASNSTVTITVNGAPTTSVAGPAQTICSSSTATLAANTAVVGTGAWTVTSGPSTSAAQFSNTASSTAVFTPAGGAGTYVLQWSITNAPCPASNSTVTITVKAPPTTSVAGPAQTICSSGTATLAANTAAVGTGTWSVTSGPSTSAAQFSSTTNRTAVFTPAGGAGTYVLQWSITNAPCPASNSTVTITVNGAPTTSVAGPAQTICSSGTATLAANTATVGTGVWSVTSGPSTSAAQFSSTASPTAVFTPAGGAGSYVLTWTITNAPCPASTSTVTITVTAPPTTSVAGPAQTICSSGTATLAANAPTVGTGTWSVTSGPSTSAAQFSSTTNRTAVFTPAGGAGTYVLQWSITNAPCPASNSTVTITVNGAPTTSVAGPAQTICSSGTATLAANTATVGTGAWSVTSGPSLSAAQFSSTTSPTAVFTPAGGAGSYVLTWTITNAPCPASTSTVTITVTAPPTTSVAGLAQTICSSGTATLAANTATVGTGTWSVTSGPSTSAAQFSSTASPTAVFTPAGGAGTYILRWSITNAPCPASNSTVTITVNGAPTTSVAGPAQTICSTGAATLAANTATVGTGAWTVTSGPSTSAAQFSSTASPTAVFTPAGGAGSYVLTWTITNAPCPASTSTVTITVTAPPTTSVAGPAQTICSSSTATLAANVAVIGTGTWSVTSGPSLSAAQFSSTASPTAVFTPAAGAGTYVLQWSIANAPCAASTSTVTITVKGTPTTSVAGPAQTICSTGTATLAANTPVVGTGAWTVTSGPSLSAAQFSSTTSPTAVFTPASGAGTYVLQWSITNAPCPASNSTVTITVTAPPTTSVAGPAQTICSSSTATLAANTPVIGTGSWSVTSGPSLSAAQFSSTASATAVFTPASGAGTYVLQWSIANAPCAASTSTVTITVKGTPTTSVAGPAQTICSTGTATLAANTPVVGTGAWTVTSGPSLSAAQFSSTTSPTAVFTPAGGTGAYVLQWSITNAPCPASNSTVTITVNPLLAPTISCGTSTNTSVQFTWPAVTGATGYTTSYKVNATAPVTGTGTSPFTISSLSPGDAVSITITPTGTGCFTSGTGNCTAVACTPSTVTVPPNVTVCKGGTVAAATFSSTPAGATFAWTNSNPAIGLAASGTGNIASFVATNATSAPITATITVTPTITPCTGTASTYTITVNPTSTIVLSSGPATQTQCSGTAITSVVYTVGGGATGATLTGTLPTGVNGSFAAGAFTISGTPTSATGSPFNYTVTTTGSSCTEVALSGTITINPILAPTVSCGTSTNTSVQFTWPAVTGATGYTTSYSVNSTAPVSGTNASPFTISSLNPGDAVSITVTPTGAGCFAQGVGNCSAVSCTPSTVTVPSNVTVCNGGTVAAATFTSTPAGATFAWTNSNPAIGLAASGTGNIASFVATNTTTAPITATITVTPTIAPCTGTASTYTITVNPTSTITLASGPATQTKCSGTAITSVVYTVGGGATGATLTGTLPTGVNGSFAAGAFTISGTPTTATTTTYTYTVTTTGSSCTEVALSGSITVNAILSPTVSCGTSTNTSVQFTWPAVTGATGYTTSYSVNSTAPVSGTNSSPFTISSLTPGDAVSITVTPTGAGCFAQGVGNCTAVACTPSTVTVPPNVTVCNGGTVAAATFTSTPAGATFAWTNNNPGIGLAASGTGNIASFVATNTTTAPITATITVTPTITPCTGTASTYTITVNPTSTITLSSGSAAQTLCSGSAPITPIVYTVGGGATGATLSGTLPTGVTGAFAAGAFTISGTPTAVTSTTYNYTVTTTGSSCTEVALSGSITVNAILSPTVSCGTSSNTSVQFTWPAVTGATGYTTSYSVNSTAPVNGTNASPFTISSLNPGDAVSITVTPTGAGCFAQGVGNCTAVACTPSTVTVPPNVTVCNGGTVAAATFTSTPAGATFAWTNDNPAIGLAASGTGNIASFVATNTTTAPITATITVTPTIAPCTGTASTYTITVNPTSTIVLSSGPATQTQCSGTAITSVVYTVGGGATGATLTGTLPTGVNGSFAAGAFTISGTPTSATGSPFNYTVTTTGSSCTEVALSGTITINPILAPTVSCGTSTNTSVQFTWPAVTGATGYTTSYSVNSTAPVNGTNASPFTISSLNPGDAVSITVTPTGAGCFAQGVGNCSAVACTPSTVTVPGNVSVCAGGTVAATAFTSNPAGATYTWTNDNPAIGLAASGTGDIASFTATNSTSSPITATITVTPTIAPCTGTPSTYTITVNPLPVLTVTSPAAVCSPSTVDITAPAVTAGSTLAGATLSYYTDAGATTPLTTPAAVATSGTYYIQALTASNCSDIKPVVVTINTTPTLTVTDPAAVCSPATVAINAPTVTAGSTGGTTFTYFTDAAATAPLTSPGAVAASGTYYIKYASATCSTVGPVVVTVNTTPTLTVTSPAGVCSPGTVDITAPAVTAGSTGGTSFAYFTDAAATTPLGTPGAVATSGTYYIQYSSATCNTVKPVVVTINTTPTLTVTDPAGVCSPGTVDITAPAVTAGSTGGTSFGYFTDAAATTTLSTPGAVGTSGTYYIKYSSATCSTVSPVVVTINPLPVLAITDPAQACSPATVDLTAPAVTSGSTGGTSFAYFRDAAATITLSSPNAVTTTGTYYIQYSSASACSVVGAVHVVINPTPVVVTQNPNAVCSPATVDITGTWSHSTLPAGYVVNYFTDAAGTMPLATPEAVSTGGVYYIVATANNCSNVPKSVTVTINPTPDPLQPTEVKYCQNDVAVPLTAQVDPGNTLILYNAAGNVLTQPYKPSTATGSSTPTHYFAAQQEGSCISTRAPLDVLVTSTPTAKVSPAFYEIYAGGTFSFAGTATGGDYVWESPTDQGSLVQGTLNQTVTPPSSEEPPLLATTYTLVVTATQNANCTARASTVVTVVQPILIPNTFSPNGDGINDVWDIKNIEGFPNAEVSIFNRYGQFVYKSGDGYRTKWRGTDTGGNDLPVGTYFYIIKTTGNAKPIAGSISIVR